MIELTEPDGTKFIVRALSIEAVFPDAARLGYASRAKCVIQVSGKMIGIAETMQEVRGMIG